MGLVIEPRSLSGLPRRHPAGSGRIVEASAVSPYFVRPEPVRVDFYWGQLTRKRDLIPKLDFRAVQNGRDCFLERGFPNGKIEECRLRFLRLDTNKPSLCCQFFRHFSNMRGGGVRASSYPPPNGLALSTIPTVFFMQH